MPGNQPPEASQQPEGEGGGAIDWNLVYGTHSARIRRIIERRAGTSAADDLLQETFERALRGEGQFNVERPMAPWLNTIAFRVTSDLRRQRLASCEVLVDEDPDVVGPDAAEEAYVARLRRIGIREAFASLSYRHRRVLHLVAVEGMTNEEVAEFEHMTIEAVKSLLARARVNFRASYSAFAERMGMLAGAALGPIVIRLRARLQRYADLAANHAGAITVAAVTTAVVGVAALPATRPLITSATEAWRTTESSSVAPSQSGSRLEAESGQASPQAPFDAVASGRDDRAATEAEAPPSREGTPHLDAGAKRTGDGAEASVEAGANTEGRRPRAFAVVEISDCTEKLTSTVQCTVIDVLASTTANSPTQE